ncbi:DUF6702 family protein [Corallibacter sp.]|uniref:DUF6702 family protein n=1 Tax=Corallibacter sp. TaxID=2038084 RepID=UPI003A939DB8
MKAIKIFLTVSFLACFAFTSAHKYYVSITQIEYVKEQKSVQLISRIFIDDFERLLRERYDETITLSKNNEAKNAQYYIEKYLKEKIQIHINGAEVALEFIGKEYENDIMYCYLEITQVSAIKTFEIKNHVLYDLFDDQQNIIRTKINGKNKSFVLIKENDKGLLNFK